MLSSYKKHVNKLPYVVSKSRHVNIKRNICYDCMAESYVYKGSHKRRAYI